MKETIIQRKIGDTTLTFKTGKLARLATSSVMVQYGNTCVLGTLVMSEEAREGMSFFPLKIDFDEKFYAAGKIGGNRFQRREGRPSNDAILVSRAIDRTVRPLFPKGFHNEVQVILTVMSYDGTHTPDMVAAIATCACVAISPAPAVGPVALGRVGMIDEELIYNPTHEQQQESKMDIIIGSLEDRVMMIEAGANEIPEEGIFKGIQYALEQNKVIIEMIEELVSKVGQEKITFEAPAYDKDLFATIHEKANADIDFIYGQINKIERQDYIKALKTRVVEEVLATLPEEEQSERKDEVKELFEKSVKKIIRDNVLQSEKRVGGRTLDQVRPIYVETDVLPCVHGSALFQRGETQSMCVTTLGSPGDAMTIDGIYGESKRRYIHHYNFPPFSVGDVRTRRFVGNREIGHGNLAEKALLPVLPSQEDFPYTIRVVNEILESNGSSSMASACGSTLSLMEAGVPITRPVSGVAMGLMVDEDGSYKVLTDLQDIEDFGGDMDFKITGTSEGITAIQVDMKIHGLTFPIIKDALTKAKSGRDFIMEKMLEVIAKPNESLKAHAPRIESIRVNPDLIGAIIGKGGETINKIIDETGAQIDINEDGLVFVTSDDQDGAARAIQWIKDLTREIKVGEVFEGKIVRVLDFGFIVQLVPGKDALCHISQLANHRVEDIRTFAKEGDDLKVKVIKIEDNGKIAVSHKVIADVDPIDEPMEF